MRRWSPSSLFLSADDWAQALRLRAIKRALLAGLAVGLGATAYSAATVTDPNQQRAPPIWLAG
ncbi:MAG: hypothetical protein JNK30_01050 [Phenylobacterium sp.]|uniref:hypothetical protein n=1 Tax=Phenylobacterium sp. TaxID=1871053 RepID=UPI001A47FE4F|nr:hypothetical protein [Phenylobacterium sp.]MBL8769942.1 hypothetical protein [Phenylobacterium sp.]